MPPLKTTSTGCNRLGLGLTAVVVALFVTMASLDMATLDDSGAKGCTSVTDRQRVRAPACSAPSNRSTIPNGGCAQLRYYAVQGTGRLASVEGLFRYLRAVGYFETASDPCARIHVFVLYENDGLPTASLHSIRELLSFAASRSVTLVRWQEWSSYAHENPWAVAEQQRLVKVYETMHHLYPDFTWAVNTPYQFFKKWVCNDLRRNHSRVVNITYERVFGCPGAGW